MYTDNEYVHRWNSFLSKIEKRFCEILSMAQTGSEVLIAQLEYDNIALINAWNGIEAQLKNLDNKIEETWNKHLDELLSDKRKEYDHEFMKGRRLSTKMKISFETQKIKILAEGARKILDNVKKHIDENKIHSCSQCSRPLPLSIYSFMGKNIKCSSCGMVNSYEPDSRVQALEHWAIIPLAHEQSHPFAMAIIEKELEIYVLKDKKKHQQTIHQIEKDKKVLEIKKTQKYYDFIIENIPEKASYYIRQKDERIKWINQNQY